MAFDPVSVGAVEIRKDANYEGVRVTLVGTLDGARCAIQVDVGYGDAVTPESDSVLFPVLLEEMPPPTLRVYPVYSVIAEKYQTMVVLGIANTRMKDYFDLWVLARDASIDQGILDRAIRATFARRGTPMPTYTPLGLSAAFAADPVKLQQWKAFLSKNKLHAPELGDVVVALQRLVGIAQ